MSPALPHFDAVPLFQRLNPNERNLLAPVCRAVAYEKGEEVFREGEPATDLCFVVIGRVKIVKAARGEQGRRDHPDEERRRKEECAYGRVSGSGTFRLLPDSVPACRPTRTPSRSPSSTTKPSSAV